MLIKFPVGILGDILAWFPYAEVFRKKHECDLYCAMAEEMIEIIKPGYPEINFVQSEERPDGLYAVITWAFSFHVMTGNTSRQISE